VRTEDHGNTAGEISVNLSPAAVRSVNKPNSRKQPKIKMIVEVSTDPGNRQSEKRTRNNL